MGSLPVRLDHLLSRIKRYYPHSNRPCNLVSPTEWHFPPIYQRKKTAVRVISEVGATYASQQILLMYGFIWIAPIVLDQIGHRKTAAFGVPSNLFLIYSDRQCLSRLLDESLSCALLGINNGVIYMQSRCSVTDLVVSPTCHYVIGRAIAQW